MRFLTNSNAANKTSLSILYVSKATYSDTTRRLNFRFRTNSNAITSAYSFRIITKSTVTIPSPGFRIITKSTAVTIFRSCAGTKRTTKVISRSVITKNTD